MLGAFIFGVRNVDWRYLLKLIFETIWVHTMEREKTNTFSPNYKIRYLGLLIGLLVFLSAQT